MSDAALNDSTRLPLGDETTQRRRRLWREIEDRTFKYLMAVGGTAVIIAIALIFFYLLYVVFPLFKPAEAGALYQYPLPGAAPGQTLYLATEEYGEVGLRVAGTGEVIFFNLRDGAVLKKMPPAQMAGAAITTFAIGYATEGLLAFGLDNGSVQVFKPTYQVSFPKDKRHIEPGIFFPLGEKAVQVDPQSTAISNLAVQGTSDTTTLVATTPDQRLVMARFTREQSLLGEEAAPKEERLELPIEGTHVSRLLLGVNQAYLFIARDDGSIDYYDLSTPAAPKLIDHVAAVPPGVRITDLRLLAGGISLLVADSRGTVTQWFPLRDENNRYSLAKVRAFRSASGPVVALAPEYFRKGFAAIDGGGNVSAYHTTAERILFTKSVTGSGLTNVAISPRADRLLLADGTGTLHVWQVNNEHPEISWSSLWGKVWYESRSQPEYIWQSSAANSDFEPKFSLTPLTVGTIKAAFYAMLFAIPLALMGAIYTAYFMSPRLRGYVKPTIEMMGALPTVILGFLAGLWLAPLIEAQLAGVMLLFLILPLAPLLASFIWAHLPGAVRHRIPNGFEALLLIPVVLLTAAFAITAGDSIEQWLFNGNLTGWITSEFGLRFDQRNSLVVGIAMGFAVVPIIFSISEDAIFGVPRHLTIGSLALGATPWQTLIRVVLLTASPGIFSAIMIGLGRAIGETMIVLMATGNTPVMDFNIFEGFRALSANTAVEMPESEVNSTHYRILFLASFLLFIATFFFNTAAEIVRQRLRRRYSNL